MKRLWRVGGAEVAKIMENFDGIDGCENARAIERFIASAQNANVPAFTSKNMSAKGPNFGQNDGLQKCLRHYSLPFLTLT